MKLSRTDGFGAAADRMYQDHCDLILSSLSAGKCSTLVVRWTKAAR